MRAFKERFGRDRVNPKPPSTITREYNEGDSKIIDKLEAKYGPTNDLELWGRASRGVTAGVIPRVVEYFNYIPREAFYKLTGRRMYLDHTASTVTRLPWGDRDLRARQATSPPAPNTLPLGQVLHVDIDVEPGVVWTKGKLFTDGLDAKRIKWLRDGLCTGLLGELSTSIYLAYSPQEAIREHPDYIPTADFSFIDPDDGREIFGAFEELSVTTKGDVPGTTIGRVKASNTESATVIEESQMAALASPVASTSAIGAGQDVNPALDQAGTDTLGGGGASSDVGSIVDKDSITPSTTTTASGGSVDGKLPITLESVRRQIEDTTAKAVAILRERETEEAAKKTKTPPARSLDDTTEPSSKRPKAPSTEPETDPRLIDSQAKQLSRLLKIPLATVRELVATSKYEAIESLIEEAHKSQTMLQEAQSAPRPSSQPTGASRIPMTREIASTLKVTPRYEQQQQQPPRSQQRQPPVTATVAAAAAHPPVTTKTSTKFSPEQLEQFRQQIKRTSTSHPLSLLNIPSIEAAVIQDILGRSDMAIDLHKRV